mgnify:CR=1 FL=1
MEYIEGFDKSAFEADHFVHRRGSSEKVFDGWGDVRYHFGITPFSCNERDLSDGRMSKRLHDELCHVYGEQGMARYFPAPETEKKREATLHFSPTSIMANGVVRKPTGRQTDFSKPMTDEEIDELAGLLAGGRW